MPNYAFYLSEYMGDVVDEESFPRLAARADEQLCRYERIYTVTEPEEGARDMAICAMVDRLRLLALTCPKRGRIGSYTRRRRGIWTFTEVCHAESIKA